MRIGHLCPVLSRQGGGLPAAVLPLAEALAELPGIAAELVTCVPPEPGTTRLAPRVARAFGPPRLAIAPGLGGVVRSTDFDVLHTHGLWSWASVVSRRRARQRRGAVIVSPHGMLDPWALRQAARRKRVAMRLLEHDHLAGATCLHALTAAEAQAIRALGIATPIVVIPNGVTPPGAPAGSPPEWMRGDPRQVLLFLGRLHPKKGLAPLIAGWGMAVTRDPALASEWRLAIAGWDDGGHLPALRDAAARSGAGDSIRFCGALHGADKTAALAHAGAFVLPSFSEGLPMAMLEAWSFGRAVFATAACNLPEGFAAGAAIPITAEPVAMAAALTQALREPRRLAAAGVAGRRLVAERFAWPSIAARWRPVYAWAAGQATAPDTVLAPAEAQA